MSWHETTSNSSGSLKTGKEKLAIGDVIEIEGEPKVWKVTHVMGSERNGWFATFKGQGSLPQGALRWRMVDGAESHAEADRLHSDHNHVPAMRGEKGDSEKVKIARITARKAIIVAVITAVSGIVVGLLSGYRTGKSVQVDDTQPWVVLKSVVAEPYSVGSAARIVVLANSQAYSYPSRAVWADIGPKMSRESFPLPVGAKELRFRFEVFYRRLMVL